MFDVGFPELIVIAIVALVVLGPERLPKAARFAGLWVRRARNQWDSVKSELERELAADELKRNLHDAQEALRRTDEAMRRSHNEAQREFNEVRDEVRSTKADDTATDVAAAAAPDAGVTPQADAAASAEAAPAPRKEPGDDRPHA
ncbi:sec-independent protein translocase protein TatB [Pseudoxanthomonas sp. GM95]|uniref:Sec-independent protein translocase protein TatB n=1 Tax=Pseudoxanthomonas sp. GM95 TaxID=1881043 RepID=UPI0008C9A700|nr:Sec-independent protein translocase protein TatB [Pseudoxanthomonas sp. GM95]SEM43092.1 sec-independent protein translocase protein TatB [Pseudoxanthomonas sp. GM95]